MTGELEIRTDLAVELNEGLRGKMRAGGGSGIVMSEEYDSGSDFKITRIEITSLEAGKRLGKPIGRYITTENALLSISDEKAEIEMAKRLTLIIRELMEPFVTREDAKVLVVGLGNRDVTCDCLGPKVTEYISVMGHSLGGGDGVSLTAIAPGVMAQTGMETADIVRGVVREMRPDVVIAVDSLAARSGSRLNTTIQLSDQGINPGSGVGNHRMGIEMRTVGVPVVAIGVPMVIGAATIVQDAIDNFTECLAESEGLIHISHMIRNLTPPEYKRMICEVLEPSMRSMYVAPRDVDASVRKVAGIIARAIDNLRT